VAPFVLLAAALPELANRVLQLDGDYPTEFLFVVGALLCAAFVLDGEWWQLVPAGLLLAAAVNARREGLIYAGAIIVAGALTAALRRRAAWIIAPGAFALASIVPWELWKRIHHIVPDSVAPDSIVGSTGGQSTGGAVGHGAWVVFEYVFKFGYWSIAPYAGLVLLVVALSNRQARAVSMFFTLVLGAAVAAMLWRLLWYGGGANVQGTPIPRISGVCALLVCAASPLLLGAMSDRVPFELPVRLSSMLPGAVAVAVVLGPAALLTVLDGAHLRAIRTPCDPALTATGPAYVVFGYPTSYARAQKLLESVVKTGFVGSTIWVDTCGRLRVQSVELKTKVVARQIAAEARSANLSPSILGGEVPHDLDTLSG
jgi:hypothetical protein